MLRKEMEGAISIRAHVSLYDSGSKNTDKRKQ